MTVEGEEAVDEAFDEYLLEVFGEQWSVHDAVPGAREQDVYDEVYAAFWAGFDAGEKFASR